MIKLGPRTQLLWHGGSQAVIAAGGALLLLKTGPTPWEWAMITTIGVIACVKGIDTLLTRFNQETL